MDWEGGGRGGGAGRGGGGCGGGVARAARGGFLGGEAGEGVLFCLVSYFEGGGGGGEGSMVGGMDIQATTTDIRAGPRHGRA